jgi:hypothetical protein
LELKSFRRPGLLTYDSLLVVASSMSATYPAATWLCAHQEFGIYAFFSMHYHPASFSLLDAPPRFASTPINL